MGLLSRSKIKNMVYPSTHGYSPSLYQIVGGKKIVMADASGALKNSDVYSVINRISSDVASAKFKTENSYVSDVLNSPSRLISRFSFWQGVLVQLLLSGNAYIPFVRGRGLEQVPPSDVQINYLKGNQGISYTVAENNGRSEMQLSQDEMLHFRLMPDAKYRYLVGMSPLESLTYETSISNSSKKGNLNAMNHAINPGGVLKWETLKASDEEKTAMRVQFQEQNEGNTGGVMVLDNSMDYTPFEIKQDVLKQLQESGEYSANNIAKAYGVPVDMMGGGSTTESQHSNIDQIKGTYLMTLNTDVNPILDELREKLNAPDLQLDIKGMIDVDDSLKINQINSMMTAGTITSNQAQFLLQRDGYLPEDLPVPNIPAEGGDNNDNPSTD
ncbi:phage portal protein (plasmid) [Pediococcus inopinatus]|uniref:phage portal protein n=1 Tax=Pediococcus inopinatus TaxID=114090 RepID=UPI002B25E5FF|nr:phage portal protein [Pediococcus inopinatus]WPC18516.1 phage portal protein [Pediococcus inopinatus]